MRVKEMHPLCCITLDNPAIGDESPDVTASGLPREMLSGGSDGNAGSDAVTCFAGVLYKWTNYSKGWRSRWFLLQNGVLSYSKIHCLENLALLPPGHDVRLIGDASSGRLSRLDSSGSRKHHNKAGGIVRLKVVLLAYI